MVIPKSSHLRKERNPLLGHDRLQRQQQALPVLDRCICTI